MNAVTGVVFDPLVPWPLIWGLAALSVVLVSVALWRGLSGWWLRALTAGVILTGLANPALQDETRDRLTDIVILVVDESASQSLPGRAEQTAAAVAAVEAEVAAMPDTELRVVRFQDGADDAGSLAMTALAEALAEEPRARVAGAILVSDGRLHDLEMAPQMPAPLHLLLTGSADDWDRRVVVRNAPAFAIIGEEVMLTLRIEDQGAAPGDTTVDLTITVDTDAPQTFSVPVNADLELPVVLSHGGQNVLQFAVAPAEGELTDRNNLAVVQMNGVRDRLRVLLVSGEPHAGERVWRNLLKSDPSVDLVHFTILRPPEKQDGIPVNELSLIAFPTRELFIEKIDEFDLIIFDRYRLRGILPQSYLESVRDYVIRGGTVLVSAGPEAGVADSLWRSPLGEILPVDVTGRVIDGGFRPAVTELGRRHPVTEGLEAVAPEGGWGRWFRMMDMIPRTGETLMTGPDDRPLLQLAREGEGRVAVLASDHVWLWGRGYEGGGPQLELLRRLAHWMLKEPELEEEALTATTDGQVLTITRRTIADTPPGPVTVTAPDGTALPLDMTEEAPGRWSVAWEAPEIGLYRLEQGDLTRVFAVGPSAPREFQETIADGAAVLPVVEGAGGALFRLEDAMPDIRQVGEGRAAAGRGWLGITPRDAFVTEDITIAALLPGWLYLLLASLLAVAAWLVEGRRVRRAVRS
jgi:hypothetical protein